MSACFVSKILLRPILAMGFSSNLKLSLDQPVLLECLHDDSSHDIAHGVDLQAVSAQMLSASRLFADAKICQPGQANGSV